MTSLAFFLVLVSVFLHAGWNFLSKSSKPSAAYYAIMSGTSSICELGFLIYAGIHWCDLPNRFWLVLGASLVCNFFYLMSLAVAYKKGDISMVYPLVRAIPVILTAGVTILFSIGKMPTTLALTGMSVVSIGCFLVPLNHFSNFNWRNYCNRTILFILIGAISISAYTIADSQASGLLRASNETIPAWLLSICYMYCIDTGNFVTLGTWTLTHKNERAVFHELFGKTWTPHVAGIFSTVAYSLVLLAMRYVTNVSYIQAFRQMSLPVGVLLGVFFLKEKCGAAKITGLTFVVIGLILTAF